MRFIYSESQNKYSNYLFSYQVLVLKEAKDSVDELYDKGFLPVRSIKNLYYLSRSCRIDLSKFELSSENKRVLKKINFNDLRLEAIGKKVGGGVKNLTKEYLTEDAVKRIFSNTGNFNYVFVFKDYGVVAARVTNNMVHYAHQFYADKSLGMTFMTSVVNYGKVNDKKYVYLGTCYEKKALYKTQFTGFEFFDGISWSDDLDKLKYLVSKDGQDSGDHLFQDEKYLKKFYGVNKLGRLIKKLRNE